MLCVRARASIIMGECIPPSVSTRIYIYRMYVSKYIYIQWSTIQIGNIIPCVRSLTTDSAIIINLDIFVNVCNAVKTLIVWNTMPYPNSIPYVWFCAVPKTDELERRRHRLATHGQTKIYCANEMV